MSDPADADESPSGPRKAASPRPVGRSRAIGEAVVVGLLLGYADSHYAGKGEFASLAYLAGGALIGLRHAGRASPCWPVLGISLYTAHVVAIAIGRKPP